MPQKKCVETWWFVKAMSVQIPYFWYVYHTSGGPERVAI